MKFSTAGDHPRGDITVSRSIDPDQLQELHSVQATGESARTTGPGGFKPGMRLLITIVAAFCTLNSVASAEEGQELGDAFGTEVQEVSPIYGGKRRTFDMIAQQ